MKSDIYISRKVLNTRDFAEWAKSQGFTHMLPEDDLHVTVVYCSDQVDWSKVTRDEPEMLFLDINEGARAVHNFDGGACVLQFDCPELTDRNDRLKALGIKSKHAEYRAHITISYQRPDGLEIEPYTGYIVLGPEIIKPINKDWKEETKEIDLSELTESLVLSESRISDFDPDEIYNIFASSYTETTGSSWSKEKFLKRAANWTFYGDSTGFVAFREQASGMRKLVAVAGETTGVVKGLKQVVDEGKPVWGAVSEKLARAAKRFGFIAPHTYPGGKLVIQTIMSSIPASVFGGVKPSITKDGGVILDYDDVGSTTKYFIANKPYFKHIISDGSFKQHIKSSAVLGFIRHIAGPMNESLMEATGTYSMFHPGSGTEITIRGGIDHGAYVYAHPEQFGLTADDVVKPDDPNELDAMAHNLDMAMRNGWVRVNHYRSAWFIQGLTARNVRQTAKYYSDAYSGMYELIADIGGDVRHPTHSVNFTEWKDIDRFIRTGKLDK